MYVVAKRAENCFSPLANWLLRPGHYLFDKYAAELVTTGGTGLSRLAGYKFQPPLANVAGEWEILNSGLLEVGDWAWDFQQPYWQQMPVGGPLVGQPVDLRRYVVARAGGPVRGLPVRLAWERQLATYKPDRAVYYTTDITVVGDGSATYPYSSLEKAGKAAISLLPAGSAAQLLEISIQREFVSSRCLCWRPPAEASVIAPNCRVILRGSLPPD